MALIKSAFSNRTLTIRPMIGEPDMLHLVVDHPDGDVGPINVRTSDLLAAIDAEGLADVAVDITGYGVAEMSDGSIKAGKAFAEPGVKADDLDDIGRCYLALARYRRENPTVDEADVEALAREMVGPYNPVDIARMMPAARNAIASGRVTVTR